MRLAEEARVAALYQNGEPNQIYTDFSCLGVYLGGCFNVCCL